MDTIENNFLGAYRQARMQHMAAQFSNANDVLTPEDSMQKGEDAENPYQKYEEMEKAEAIQELKSDIEKGNVEIEEIEKAGGEVEIEKAYYGDTEENREKERVGQEIEKSDIMYALSGMDGIKVSKTGKEIKDQVDSVVLPELNSALATKKAEATKLLEDCGNAPTKDVYSYWTGDIKMDVGYKMYDWDETYIPENPNRLMPSLSAADSAEKKGNIPENANQAKARRDYNEVLRAICNIMVDIKACEILKNLKDKTEYELTPRQVLTLKF